MGYWQARLLCCAADALDNRRKPHESGTGDCLRRVNLTFWGVVMNPAGRKSGYYCLFYFFIMHFTAHNEKRYGKCLKCDYFNMSEKC